MKILGDSIALSVCCTDRYRMSSCWASRPHFTKAERTRRKATRVGLFCHYPWLRWLSPVHSLGCHLCFPFSLAQWEWQAPRSAQRLSTVAENLCCGLQSIDCRTDLPTVAPRMPCLPNCILLVQHVSFSFILIHISMPYTFWCPPKNSRTNLWVYIWTM